MGNPSTRVLALLELLQSHGLMSGSALAARLEVDPRTLRRYILALESLGIPVLVQRGRDGGYRLMQGFKLPPMMLPMTSPSSNVSCRKICGAVCGRSAKP